MTESSPFEPQQPDKQRLDESFTKRWVSLLRRREQADHEQLESDADTESDEKPKKWRKVFGKIFPKLVEPPAGNTDKPEKGFDLDTWLSWSGVTLEKGNSQSEQLDQPLVDIEQEPIELTETASTDVASDPQEATASPEVQQNIVSTTTEEPPQETNRATQLTFMAPDAQAQRRQQSESPIAFESVRTVASSPAEQEIIINRRGSNALPVVLVGAEYLGRKKADKKLEKRLNEKIDASNEDIRHEKMVQQELKSIISQNREQIESLKRQRAQQEQGTIKNSTEFSSKLAQEKPTPVQREKPSRTEVKQTPLENRETIQPRKIFEQVADAAEHDVPVERVFERSHEVKDDTPVAVGAASVGSVVATQVPQIPHLQGSIQNAQQTSRDPAPVGLPPIHGTQLSNDYQQAMAAGFWAAIAIIILGSIAYQMIK